MNKTITCPRCNEIYLDRYPDLTKPHVCKKVHDLNEARQIYSDLMNSFQIEDLVDNDGYPTDYTLLLIEHWLPTKPKEWFDFIETVWHFKAWGWKEEETTNSIGKPIIRYSISTGGWSGNESIINAMKNNWILWSLHWYESRRGGHYVFERPVN